MAVIPGGEAEGLAKLTEAVQRSNECMRALEERIRLLNLWLLLFTVAIVLLGLLQFFATIGVIFR